MLRFDFGLDGLAISQQREVYMGKGGAPERFHVGIGAYCLWYCFCQKDPIARANRVTDQKAQQVSSAHERGEHSR